MDITYNTMFAEQLTRTFEVLVLFAVIVTNVSDAVFSVDVSHAVTPLAI